MMSSKRAASKVWGELFDLIDRWLDGDKTVFRPYSKMDLSSMSPYAYSRRLKKFKQHRLIQRKKKTKGVEFVLTQRARLLRRKAVSKQLRGDGKSTLIIFDIPEEKHNARDTFRRYLIRNGYTQMKRSAFLSPFKVSEDLKDLIKELKLEKNITIFSASVEPAIKP